MKVARLAKFDYLYNPNSNSPDLYRMIKHKICTFLCILILLLVTTANRTAAADYATSSVLASGRWVKIHIDSTSVYRISYPTLRSWGFENPEQVRVFGYGSVEQAHLLDTAPDDLPPTAVWHTADALYFYGEGDHRDEPATSSLLNGYRNYYSRGSCYFLTASLSGSVISETATTPAKGTPVTTHISIDCRYPEEINFHSAGVFFFSKDIANRPDGLKYTFSAPDFADKGTLGFRYAYLHGENFAQNLAVNFDGDVKPGSFTPTNHNHNVADNHLYTISSLKTIPILSASETPFDVRFTIPADKHFDHLALSEVYLMYPRENRFRGPVMQMHFAPVKSSALSVSLSDLPNNIEIWNVGDPRNVTRFSGTTSSVGGNPTISLPAQSDRPLKLCLFTPGPEIPQPAFEGTVCCRNLHGLPSVDYLIVTTENFLHEAERLAAAHREIQGLEVAVVTQNEVFNEFSSGVSHPNGLRKFVNMLHDRADRPLRYLLLMGCPTYDPRRAITDDGIDYLVGYQVERMEYANSSATDYATDSYFGLTTEKLSDNIVSTTSEIQISVGRAPVISEDEARIFVDKSIAYLRDPQLAGRPDLAVLVACQGDNDAHLNGSENLRNDIQKNYPSATCSRIYNALYPFDKMQDIYPTFAPMASQIARGPFLINYTGHSGHSQLGSVLSDSYVDRLTFGSMPVTFLASCETTPIDNTYRGIGAKLFLHPSGPIALIGSGRAVYLSNNQVLNDEFVRRLTESDGPERLGDVWRQTLNTTGKRGIVQRINNSCYNFLADPALPVRRPDRKAVLTADTGGSDTTSTITAPSLTPIDLKGRVTHSDGTTDTDFTGSLILSLYDAPRITQRYVHSAGDSDTIMQLDEDLLFETAVEVKKGLWEARLTPPLSSRSGVNRLSMLGYSDNGHIACGVDSTLTVTNPLTGISPDTIPPQIDSYINSPDIPDGALIGPDPVLYVTISDDESGIANGSANIGTKPTAILDSYTNLRDFGSSLRFMSDGSARIVYPLGSISSGRHTLTMSVHDVAGNTSKKTLTFTVINTSLEATLSADSTIVRESVILTLHTSTADAGCRLLIRDVTGATVFSQKNISFPYVWDFRDNDGRQLPDATYRASVMLSDGLRYGATPETSFTLIRPKY